MSREGLRIAKRIGFVNSMSLVERMNPVDFLDSMHIVTIGLNHLMGHLLD